MTTKTPVLLLGGKENLVSVARALVARGVPVVTVADNANPGHRSRGVRPEPIGPTFTTDSLRDWFDKNGRNHAGAVVVPLSDPALIFVSGRYSELQASHRPAVMRPDLVTALLDKQSTNALGRKAGVAVPGQWLANDHDDLARLEESIRFPVIVKPRHTFEFLAATGRKFLKANDFDELRSSIDSMTGLTGGFVINQFIEGPDTELASYYALRQDRATVLSFTKRIFRRHPRNEGGATLHQLIDLPEVAEQGEMFFDHIGIEGLANVEFKRNRNDGRWYLIECNYRLTAANELMQRSGIDVIGAVYRQALGLPLLGWEWDGRTRYFWYPVRDLRSAVHGDPGPGLWLKMFGSRPVMPYWSIHDPAPSLRQAAAWTGRQWRRKIDVASDPGDDRRRRR